MPTPHFFNNHERAHFIAEGSECFNKFGDLHIGRLTAGDFTKHPDAISQFTRVRKVIDKITGLQVLHFPGHTALLRIEKEVIERSEALANLRVSLVAAKEHIAATDEELFDKIMNAISQLAFNGELLAAPLLPINRVCPT